ncbi:hypothetical protein ACH427_16715 [Streptomyces sp. NPDC020379]|uniref:hypothetical protein n=1 Tax=Streptomyces sp. NPDC020379 TaxID=3365071 RepID=UPI00379D6AE2
MQPPIDMSDPLIRTALQAVRRHLATTEAALSEPDPRQAASALSASAHEAHAALAAAGLADLPDGTLLGLIARLDAPQP